MNGRGETQGKLDDDLLLININSDNDCTLPAIDGGDDIHSDLIDTEFGESEVIEPRLADEVLQE